MEKIEEYAMDLAIHESKMNLSNRYQKGGPFGAVIVKDGEILATGHNTVFESVDATAHAEINAIRQASKILGRSDLSDCTLFTSTEPCPMCLAAIIWANIRDVYYVNTRCDAARIGFRDDMIYQYIKGEKKDILNMHRMENEEALKVFLDFQKLDDKRLY